jgi:hypothetical protein
MIRWLRITEDALHGADTAWFWQLKWLRVSRLYAFMSERVSASPWTACAAAGALCVSCAPAVRKGKTATSTARKLRDSVLRREIVLAMVEKARDKHEIVMGITSFAI